MPLVKSKSDAAFKKNVATEVKAGKPVKQAVAIAYATKRSVGKKDGGNVKLSIGRGEKRPTDQGAGLTAKGRAKVNRETGSNLKPPQAKGPRHDSFCARMKGVVKNAKGPAERAKASLKNWNC